MRLRACISIRALMDVLSIAIVLAASTPISHADTTLQPLEGPVILTVSGAIRVHTDPVAGVAEFDRAALEDLGLVHLRTRTRWTEGVQDFEGVLLRDLLDRKSTRLNSSH